MSYKLLGSSLDLFDGPEKIIRVRARFSVIDDDNNNIHGEDVPDAFVVVVDTQVENNDTIASLQSRLVDIARTVVWRNITIDSVLWVSDTV